jgi:hypothetical protein
MVDSPGTGPQVGSARQVSGCLVGCAVVSRVLKVSIAVESNELQVMVFGNIMEETSGGGKVFFVVEAWRRLLWKWLVES